MDITYSYQAWRVIHDRDKKPWSGWKKWYDSLFDDIQSASKHYDQQLEAYENPLAGILGEIERGEQYSPMYWLKDEMKGN